jgi:Tol biopolymer transport system component
MNPANLTYVVLWVSDFDGAGARELFHFVPFAGETIYPIGWSPDGSTILFVEGVPGSLDAFRDGMPLQAAPAKGLQPFALEVTVILTAVDKSTTPDRSLLAIVTGEGRESWTNKTITLLDAALGRTWHVTTPDVSAIAPAWSSDGGSIVYVSAPDLGPGARDAALARRRLWLMAPDGSNQRQLTTGELFRDEKPQWSRDGQHILFARLTTEPCDSSEYDLLLLDVASGSIEPVLTGLPLFGTDNERLVVGEVPKCRREDDSGWTTDSMGRLNLGLVMDWWQTP